MLTILGWYRYGGPFIIPLIVVGVVGLVLFVERVAYLVLRSRIHARPFIERVLTLVGSGELDEALQLCVAHRASLPDVGLVILRSRPRDEGALLDVAEASMRTVVPGLTRGTPWLEVLARVSLLLGLLGAAANAQGVLAASNDVAGAVRAALAPLGVAVFTAVPLVIGHTYLVHEAQRITQQLEEFATRLVNAIVGRPAVRLGHR